MQGKKLDIKNDKDIAKEMFERQHNGRIRRKLKTKEERPELLVNKGRKNNKILGIIKTLDFFFFFNNY